jgi:hypothetical protein
MNVFFYAISVEKYDIKTASVVAGAYKSCQKNKYKKHDGA